MVNERYKPPEAELTGKGPPRRFDARWIALALAGICVAMGIVRILAVALASVGSSISMVTLYIFCVGPILWCVLGYLLYTRSKLALTSAVAAIVAPFLLWPWGVFLLNRDIGGDTSHFNYWTAVSLGLRSPGIETLLYVAVLAFTAWDYRERFAGWRKDEVR